MILRRAILLFIVSIHSLALAMASPTADFPSSGSSQAESSGNVALTVNLSSAATQLVTIGYTYSSTTAKDKGIDFTLSAGNITITTGASSGVIPITIHDDNFLEASETIGIDLVSFDGAVAGEQTHFDLVILDDDSTGDPEIGFQTSSFSMFENQTSIWVPVTLSKFSGNTVTVSYTVSGTATQGVDYSLNSGSMSFSSGTESQTLYLGVLDDALVEGTETLIITLSTPSGASLSASSVLTVSIIDNDITPVVEFREKVSSVAENSSTSLPVVLSQASGNTVTVNYDITGGTASGNDYIFTPGILTFSPGSTTQYISFSGSNDSAIESIETAEITLSTPSNATVGTGCSTHTISLTDNDTEPAVYFASTNYSVSETSGYAYISVYLSHSFDQNVSVDYAITGGTATVGSDFVDSAETQTLTFTPGQTAQNIFLTIKDDIAVESNETVILSLSNPSNAAISVGTTTLTIVENNDGVIPTVQFSSITSSQHEYSILNTLVVSLSESAPQAITFDVAVTGGNASSGNDFSYTPSTITISTGSSVAYVSYSHINDTTLEGNETIEFTLSNSTNSTIGTNSTHTHTILDNDHTPSLSMWIGQTSIIEGQTTFYTVYGLLSHQYDSAITVEVTTSGTATQGSDYTLSSNIMSFSAGSVWGNTSLTFLNDTLAESNETIVLNFGATTGNVTLSESSNTFTVVIKDNESVPEVTFSTTSRSVWEYSSTSSYINLSTPVDTEVIVNVEMTDGTAIFGSDYTTKGLTVTVPAGTTSQYFSVDYLINDFVQESQETFSQAITRVSNNATIGSSNTQTIYILDNDDVSVYFSGTSSSIWEGNSTNQWIYLTRYNDYPVSVQYYVDSSGNATPCDDFSPHLGGNIIFNTGDTSEYFSVYTTEDTIQEDNETFIYKLMSPIGATLGSNTFTYTIIDDDQPPTVYFASSTGSAFENASTSSVLVTLSSSFSQAISVDYTITGGSATNGSDYTLSNGTLTFAAGTTIAAINISLTDDSAAEGDETITLSIANPTAGATLGTITSHVFTILDDETTPTLTIPPMLIALESAGNVSVDWSYDRQALATTSFNYSVTGETANQGSDYATTGDTVSVNSGLTSGTFNFEVLNDSVSESAETAKISISNGSGLVIGTSEIQVVIADDDADPIRQKDTTAILQSATNFGGTGDEQPLAMARSSNGSIYIAGEFSETVDFDPGSGVASATALMYNDIFVTCYDSNGNFQWVKTLPSESSVSMERMRVDTDGNLVLVGTYYGTIDLDPGDGTSSHTTNGSEDVFIVKLSSSGDFIWGKSLGGSGSEIVSELRLDSNNNVLVLGSFSDTVDFDPGEGTNEVTATSAQQKDKAKRYLATDGFLLKLDGNGNFSYVKTFGGTSTEDPDQLVLDGNGEMYLSGTFQGTTDLDPGTGTSEFTSEGLNDVFLMKLDANGGFVWGEQLGSNSTDDIGGIALTPNGELLVLATFGSNADIGNGGRHVDVHSSSTKDYFLINYNSNREYQWHKAIYSEVTIKNPMDVGELYVDDKGLIYISGAFTGATDFDISSDSIDVRRSYNANYQDGFFSRYTKEGTHDYTKTFGGNAADEVDSFIVNGTEIYLTGYFKETVDLDPGTSTNEVTSSGNKDAFLLKFTQTLPADSELSFAATPHVTVGGRSKIWVTGGVRPYTYEVSGASASITDGTLRGLSAGSFSLTVTDNQGTVITTEGTVSDAATNQVTLTFPGFSVPGDFVMVSVPLYIDQSHTQLKEILVSKLGAMSEDNFMAFDYTNASGDGYEDLNSANFQAGAGRGMWMATIDGAVVPLSGQGPSGREIVEVNLKQGWNIVGNPYSTSISTDSIYVETGTQDAKASDSTQGVTSNHFWNYSRTGGQYVSLGSLEAGQGAWIFVFAESAKLFFVPSSAQSGVQKAKADRLMSEIELSDNEPIPPGPPSSGVGSSGGGGGGCFLR